VPAMRRATQGFCSLSQVQRAGEDLRDAVPARIVLAGFNFAVPCPFAESEWP
jgi:uncharacterized protein YjbI with pentapeptide repeats